jgi:hypothetical protein
MSVTGIYTTPWCESAAAADAGTKLIARPAATCASFSLEIVGHWSAARVATVGSGIDVVVCLPSRTGAALDDDGIVPFRVHIDPADDGAEFVNMVGDRIRTEFYERVELRDLLQVSQASSQR